MTTIQITATVEKPSPDPSSPTDPTRSHIGMLRAQWTDGDFQERSAAIIKVATGRGVGDLSWGPYMLVLRWIGDQPPAQIAQSVYDLILDSGPQPRQIKRSIVSQPRTEAQPSYRAARAS